METEKNKLDGGGDLASLLGRGTLALEDGEWEAAKGFFNRVLDADFHCGEAYLGLFLAEEKASTPEDLVSQQKNALANAQRETLFACGEDSGRIAAAVEKYTVKGGLTAEKITELFPFDRSYESAAFFCKERLAAFQKNKNLQRAQQYGEEAMKAQVQKLLADGTALWEENLAKAQREDEAAVSRIRADYARHLDEAEAQAKRLQEQALTGKKKKRLCFAAITAVAAVLGLYLLVTLVILPANAYKKAETLLAAGEYKAAMEAFIALEDYKDAPEQVAALRYQTGQWQSIATRVSHTVGLCTDGMVVATEYMGEPEYNHGQVNVDEWENIVAVAAGNTHTVGLCKDNSVIATEFIGDPERNFGQCDVDNWKDIVAITAGSYHTVGLCRDGSVVAVGNNEAGQCEVDDWTDIVAIAAGQFHTVGLRLDGTVVATGWNGASQCEVSDWMDIVAIAAGYKHTVGLRSDGTVVATEYTGEYSYYGQCKVSGWRDIVAISAGMHHTVGLRSDGTVVATEFTGEYSYYSYYGQCEVSDWTDIVAIAAGLHHTVGLRSDGTVVSVGWNNYGECEVSDWTDILVPGKVTG